MNLCAAFDRIGVAVAFWATWCERTTYVWQRRPGILPQTKSFHPCSVRCRRNLRIVLPELFSVSNSLPGYESWPRRDSRAGVNVGEAAEAAPLLPNLTRTWTWNGKLGAVHSGVWL